MCAMACPTTPGHPDRGGMRASQRLSGRKASKGCTAAVCAVLLILGRHGEAHKPVTSPFTFNQDVLPIVRTQCGACHVPGGVAPMSLMTHADAVPWGESIRAELMAGHMPPWSVESARGHIQNEQVLTARELNILMTWASGGTPAGDEAPTATAPSEISTWSLGEPDLTLLIPQEHLMGADVQEEFVEYVVPTGLREARLVKAVDLRPGTAAIVRAATVRVRNPTSAAPGAPASEPVVAVWVPGDQPVASADAAFALPAGAELVVRVHYRKTWEIERQALTDRSAVGLYFASDAAVPIHAIRLDPSSATPATPSAVPVSTSRIVAFTRVVGEHVQALAIYPDATLFSARVVVAITRPDGSREELIAFRPQRHWARRYWFASPVDLPAGTTITVTADLSPQILPPGALPVAPPQPSDVGVTLNVTDARGGGER